MQLEGTPGQRLGIYLAEPGTPDYDAMILLDLAVPRYATQPAASGSTDGDPAASALNK
jgi:hypothetical protein